MGRKHCGKRRNCSLRAIFPFPTVFSKDLYCRQVKTRVCLFGKGLREVTVSFLLSLCPSVCSIFCLYDFSIANGPISKKLHRNIQSKHRCVYHILVQFLGKELMGVFSTLTHYQTVPHFDALKIYSCGKHCEKRRNCL